jgi:hypothetical protein
MSPPQPFDIFPIQSLSRQSEFAVHHLFKVRKWAIAGEDNLSDVQAGMMLAASTKGCCAFPNDFAGQVPTRVFSTI